MTVLYLFKKEEIVKVILNIVEGFDFCGKGALINTLSQVDPNINIYRPDYSAFDSNFSRNYAVLYGYGIMDFISSTSALKETDQLVVMDRGLPSSAVYSRLYFDGVALKDEFIRSYLKKLYDSAEIVEFIYVKHKDKASAKRIYESDKNHDDKLDEFDDFEHYWRTYIKANELYMSFFDKYSLYPTIYESESTMDGRRVKLVQVVS